MSCRHRIASASRGTLSRCASSTPAAWRIRPPAHRRNASPNTRSRGVTGSEANTQLNSQPAATPVTSTRVKLQPRTVVLCTLHERNCVGDCRRGCRVSRGKQVQEPQSKPCHVKLGVNIQCLSSGHNYATLSASARGGTSCRLRQAVAKSRTPCKWPAGSPLSAKYWATQQQNVTAPTTQYTWAAYFGYGCIVEFNGFCGSGAHFDAIV